MKSEERRVKSSGLSLVVNRETEWMEDGEQARVKYEARGRAA